MNELVERLRASAALLWNGDKDDKIAAKVLYEAVAALEGCEQACDKRVRKVLLVNEQRLDEIAGLKERVALLERALDAMLKHCPDAECTECGEAICPHGDGMHFHHDGCPSCAAAEVEKP